jgi:hypothetical protein
MCGVCSLSGQTIRREVIGSSGGSEKVDGVILSHTTGQPYHTVANYDHGMVYRPGFQQPASGAIIRMSDNKIVITLFPNPAASWLTVRPGGLIHSAEITIKALDGRPVYKEIIRDLTEYQISCEDWNPGAYVVNVCDLQLQSCSSKLVIVQQ